MRGTGHVINVPGARICSRPRTRRRGAALLLLTLSVSMLLAGLGVTLIAMQRADRQLQDNLARTDELKRYARSGIEMTLAFMENVPNWRSLVGSSFPFGTFPIGNGSVTVRLFDDHDGQIGNNDTDPVRIRATAQRDGTTFQLEAQLVARPHPAIKYALFQPGSATMQFNGTAICRGPVRAHGNITAMMLNAMQDDASFETLQGYGIQDPLAPKVYVTTSIAAPQPDLKVYKAMATPIAGLYGTTCQLIGYNLTPTSNPLGAPNPDGIYSLDAGGREVYIENLHVKGTLIIYNTAGNKVGFTKGLWIEPGPLQYPVLLIDCPLNIIDIYPSQATLVEATSPLMIPNNGSNVTAALSVDFNEDGNVLGTPITQVRGLIWGTGTTINLRNGSWHFIGCCIGPALVADNAVSVDNDLTLLSTPCPGFMQSGMKVLAGSYREVAP